MIGGALARPCISYPQVFAKGTIWDRFPYLLPNLFSAVTVLVGVTIGLLFLDETHALKKHQRDRPRELGRRIANLFTAISRCGIQGRRSPEKQPLLKDSKYRSYDGTDNEHAVPHFSDDDDDLPAYRSQESSPKLLPADDANIPSVAPSEVQQEAPREVVPTKIFTKPVLMNIVSYGILAL
jgi:hypothetical protein